MLRPLLAICNPLIHHASIPRLEANLEGFRLRRQSRGDGVAIQGIQHWSILWIIGFKDLKSEYDAQERCIEFAIGEM